MEELKNTLFQSRHRDTHRMGNHGKNNKMVKLNHEQGIVLFLSLILLMTMTLIAAATFYSSLTGSKIANNLISTVEQNASDDVARTFAVNWLNNKGYPPPTCISTAKCQACPECVWKQGTFTTANRPATQAGAWWNTAGNAFTVNAANGIACAVQAPQYTIEELNCDKVAQLRTYRVTTRTAGTTSIPPANPVIREYIVQPTLRPKTTIFMDASCSAQGGQYNGSVTNTFVAKDTGDITSLWIGTTSYSSGTSALVTISVNSNPPRPAFSQTLPFSAPNAACSLGPPYFSGNSFIPRSNMGVTSIPKYRIIQGETVSITIGSGSFHNLASYPAAFIRMTVDGIGDLCTVNAAPDSHCNGRPSGYPDPYPEPWPF